MALNGPRERVFYLPALLPTRPGRRNGTPVWSGSAGGPGASGRGKMVRGLELCGPAAASSGARRRAKVRQSGEVDPGGEDAPPRTARAAIFRECAGKSEAKETVIARALAR